MYAFQTLMDSVNRELKQQQPQQQQKCHLKINIEEMVTIAIIASSPNPLLLTEHTGNWTGRSAIEVNVENERFIVVSSRCGFNHNKFKVLKNLKFENFTLSFGRLRQRIVVKCVPHVQHDYLSSFNQSDHCSLAL